IGAGSVAVGWASTTPMAGSGSNVLLYLDVTYGVGPADRSPVTATIPFNGGAIPVTLDDGSVTLPDVVLVAPANFVGQAGQTVEIPITVQALEAGDNVIAVEFTLSYDAAVIDITAAENPEGTLAESCLVQSNAGSGTITVGVACSSAIAANDTLLFLHTELLAAGTSALDFQAVTLNAGTPIGGGADGMVTVAGNAAPVFTTPAADTTITITEGDSLEVAFAAVDPQGADVTLTLTTGAGTPNATFENGVLTFAPDLTQAGTYTFTVTASDGQLTSTRTVTVVVEPCIEISVAELSGLHEGGFATMNAQ